MVWFAENKAYISEEKLAFLLSFAFSDYNFAKKKDGYSIRNNDWKEFNLLLKICDTYGISMEESYLKGDYVYDIDTMKKVYTKTFYRSFKKLFENSFSLKDLKILSNTKDTKELNSFKKFYPFLFLKLNYDFKKISNYIKKDLKDYINLYINRQLKNVGSRKVAYESKKDRLYNLLLEEGSIYADGSNKFSLESKSLMNKGMVNDFALLFFHDSLALYSEGFIKNIGGISYNQDRERCSVRVVLNENKLKVVNDTKKVSGGKKDKIKIIISEYQGIYLESKPKRCYPILRKSQGFSIIKELKEGNKCWEDLAVFIGEGRTLTLESLKNDRYDNRVSGVIRKTNKLFGDKLALGSDLIVSVPTGGYELNHKKYNIKFKK